MNASDVEIYNAIDGSVWFNPQDIEELTAAIQRTATDPLGFVEVGRMYTAMVHKNVLSSRERNRTRAIENRKLLMEVLGEPRWELTPKGNEQVTIVDALRNGGVL